MKISEDSRRISPFSSIVLAVLTANLVFVITLLAAFAAETAASHLWLARWSVRALSFAALLAAAGACLEYSRFRSAFHGISRFGRRALGCAALAGFVLAAFAAPRTNRIYFDEHIYENIAQSIVLTGEAVMGNEGQAEFGVLTLQAKEYNKQPNAYPFYLSIFFRLFGINESVAHWANNFTHVLAICGCFLLALGLWRSEAAAAGAAFVYALFPTVLIWSNTAAAEPAAAAFSVLALCAVLWLCRTQTAGAALLALGMLSLAVQFRPESPLLLFPAVLLGLVLHPAELRRPRLYWLLFILLLLLVPALVHLVSFSNHPWGSAGPKISGSSFWPNLLVNGPFYFDNRFFPATFSVLALLGLIIGGEVLRERAVVGVWFLLSWGIFLFFYAGSYGYGADVRYCLISAPPLALFSGLGFARLAELPLLRTPERRLALTLVLVLLWLPFLPHIRAVTEEAVEARADVDAARRFAAKIPSGAVVLTHNPGMWLLWQKNAAQTSLPYKNLETADRHLFAQYPGGVFLHWNFWCEVPDPPQNKFCHYVKDNYLLEVVDEVRARDKHFVLYRLAVPPERKMAEAQQGAASER